MNIVLCSNRLWSLFKKTLFFRFLDLLDAGGDGGDHQHQGQAHHRPVLSGHWLIFCDKVFFLLTEKFFLLFFFFFYSPRSLWLQRRRWGIQRWVKSVAGGKPRRHGTRCSWEHIFYFNQYQLWFNSSFWFYKPTFWRQFSLRPDSFLPCCRWTISSLESHTLKAVFFLHNFSIRYL